MSTAQNTKSTSPAMRLTSEASPTTRSPTRAGIGVAIAQRPLTAALYGCPADLALAATAVTLNHGCPSSSDTYRCPTMPVAPRTPTLNSRAMTRSLRRCEAVTIARFGRSGVNLTVDQRGATRHDDVAALEVHAAFP